MTGSVYGNVVLAESGDPVAGATVVCGKSASSKTAQFPAPTMSALTDSAGWFRFDNLAAGEWQLRTHRAGGYSVPDVSVCVFDDALSETTLEVLSHSSHYPSTRPVSGGAQNGMAYGNVRGRVVDTSSGEPIGYATVVVVSGPGPVPVHMFVASSAGWFELDGVPVGDWLLRAHSDTGVTGMATVRVDRNALSNLTILVDRMGTSHWPASATAPIFTAQEYPMTGQLIGHVVYAGDGKPVANATVTILRGAGPAPDIAPMTDRNGRFTLGGLPAGSWLLRAVGPGGEAGLVQVSMRPGSTTEVLIKLTDHVGN